MYAGTEALRKLVAAWPRLLMTPAATRQAVLDWCAARGWTHEQTMFVIGCALLFTLASIHVCKEPKGRGAAGGAGLMRRLRRIPAAGCWKTDRLRSPFMTRRQPHLLCLDAAKLQRNVDELEGACGYSPARAEDLVRDNPELLLHNLASPRNLRKLEFLSEVIGRPTGHIDQFPAYFNCSLGRNIAPRTYVLMARGLPLSPSLSYLRVSAALFPQRVGMTAKEYEEWVAAWRTTPEGRKWGA